MRLAVSFSLAALLLAACSSSDGGSATFAGEDDAGADTSTGDPGDDASVDADDEGSPLSTDPDGPEPTDAPKVVPGTVADAIAQTCTTATVQALSLQIIRQGQCLEPTAYAKLPALSNVQLANAVFGYLEAPARDALVAAANANPGMTLNVTSMLRTIAQQYLVYRWYQKGSCGIGLAAKPGASNHETGLAFDTPDASAWRTALAGQGFQWFGTADPVHFDFKGAGAKSWKGLDVKAFQTLWNANNPSDTIAADGVWGPQTQARLEQAPAKGFAIGPSCDPDAGPDAGQGSTDAAPEASQDAAQMLDGAISTWSCTGSYGTHPMADGKYYGTAFGCWTDSNGAVQTDPGDNCIPTCISQAQSSGLCAGMSGKECEASVNWYAADGARFGCLARLRVTNPANGKAVILVALDYGPSCTVEKSVSHAVLDMSTPANLYLFGSQQGASDRALVQVDLVDPATPLGPVP